MVFTAYQSEGAGRGIANQPLYEVRPTGYYWGVPITDLMSDDVVLIYISEIVYYENDVVFISTEDFIFYEGYRIHYEGEWVFSFDDLINEIVTWVGNPVGSGEYRLEIIETNVKNLVTGQGKVLNIYDERPAVSAAQLIIK